MFLLFLACVPSAPPGHGATEPAVEIHSLCAAGGQVVVEGDLDLSAATAEDVRGLDCVVAVLGDLIVDHNPELSRLDGLEQLVVVSGALRLRGNAVLTTLEDLAALDVVAGELEVLDHPGFCDAQVDALLYRMGGDPAAVIRAGNTGPCPAGRWEEAVNDENAAYVCSGYSFLAVVGPLVLDAVDNLAGLDCITDAGDLYVRGNPQLQSLEGLEQLRHPGAVIIRDNPQLASLRGLEGVLGTGDLQIAGNPLLSDLVGLEQLSHVAGALEIQENPALRSLDGLEALQGLRQLRVSGNGTLQRIDALAGIGSLDDLWIYENPALESLEGLSSVEEVAGQLVIMDNATLPDLEGLTGLRSTSSLYLSSNARLHSLAGLEGLSTVERLVHITDHPQLCDAAVDRLLGQLAGYSGTVENTGNTGVCE